MCSLCSSLQLYLVCPLLWYLGKCPPVIFLHLQLIYPVDCSCKVSFHLVPMVLLVMIQNIRDQAEVETSRFSHSCKLVLDGIPPATSIACALIWVHIQLQPFSRSLKVWVLAYLFIYSPVMLFRGVCSSSICSVTCFQDRVKVCVTLPVHFSTSEEFQILIKTSWRILL